MPERAHGDGRRGDVSVVLRPLATPLPIGLIGFAMGSFVAAAYTLGWVPVREQQNLALVLLGFAFPFELVAAMIAVVARDAVASTTLSIFAGQWLIVGLVLLTSPLGARSQVLGVFSVMLSAIIAVPAIAAAKERPTLALALVLAGAQSLMSGIATLSRARDVADAAAIVGLVLTGAAIYAALALLLEATFARTVLPLSRRRSAEAAIRAPLAEQVTEISSEAGVRKRL